jgi:uncharacterized integral membrane protein (TIGR00697 family)
MGGHRFLPVLTGFFTAALLMSNILASKIFAVGELSFPASLLVFPLSYAFGDILTEVYGYSASRRVVWTGLFSQVIAAGLLAAAIQLPPAAFWPNQQAFDAIFAQTPRIVAGSIIAYFAGEFLNSFVLAKMKVLSHGKCMWGRFVASTVVGEFADTALFCGIAFVGQLPLRALFLMILANWAAKVLWEVFALPLSLSLASWLKRVEREDCYDTKTNFNPFALGD